MPRSGLQRRVLQLYRELHRAVQTKPAANRPALYRWMRGHFRHDAALVTVKDVDAIEHLLRRGQRRLEALRRPDFLSVDL